MTIPSPIHETIEKYELDFEFDTAGAQRDVAATGEYQGEIQVEFLSWGDSGCTVLATIGNVELEYAAIQKGIGIFDATSRGTISITGPDSLGFIERMTTQKLTDLQQGEARLAFSTSRKGSIVADVIVRKIDDQILIDLDASCVQQFCDHLQTYIVMEDVTVENVTQTVHWLWCFGDMLELKHEDVQVYSLPLDLLGIKGTALAMKPESVEEVWKSLVKSGARPIGWYALNMARIEQGAPMFMIDFDSSSLPHETSLISSRVRFDKGCYLGQEIVARMENLGQPKQRLMQVHCKADELPIAGAQIWSSEETTSTPIGVVTSSAISPLGGGIPVVIAMITKKIAVEDTKVFTYVGSDLLEGEVKKLHRANVGKSHD